jgi:hypothetical protein
VRSQQRKNGSYGLVVLIDFLTWGFLWFVSNLYFPKDGKDYKESLVTILLPTLAILREMANAIEPIHMGPATVDLLVGALFAGAWILLPDVDEQASHPQYTRLIKFFISIGCIYGVLFLIDNSLSHFFGVGSEELRGNKVFAFWFNVGLVVVAIASSAFLFCHRSKKFEALFAAPCA